MTAFGEMLIGRLREFAATMRHTRRSRLILESINDHESFGGTPEENQELARRASAVELPPLKCSVKEI